MRRSSRLRGVGAVVRLEGIGADAEHGVLRSDLFKLHQERSPIHRDVRAAPGARFK